MNLPLCVAWNTTGVTVAGNEDGISGSMAGRLFAPQGLYATKDGRLYVADSQNDRVMKYTWNGSRGGTQIGSGAGEGLRQMLIPTAVAVDEKTGKVYINDYKNERIQRWTETKAGGTVEIVIDSTMPSATAVAAKFSAGTDIQLDPRSGDHFYVLDAGSARVTRWNHQKKINEISYSVSYDSRGIHVDAQRNVFVAQCDENQILKLPNRLRVAGSSRPGNTTAHLNCPSAVVVDDDGRIFIADTNNHRIVLWDPIAQQGLCLVGCSASPGKRPDQLHFPYDLTFDWKWNLLVADNENNRVQRFDFVKDSNCRKQPNHSEQENSESSTSSFLSRACNHSRSFDVFFGDKHEQPNVCFNWLFCLESILRSTRVECDHNRLLSAGGPQRDQSACLYLSGHFLSI